MFAGLRRALGAITVRENRGVITVSGIPADVIARDIEKIWSTSRVNKWMFNRLGKSEFSFYSFFAIEIAFILRSLIENPKAHTNVRALRIILDKLEEETWLNSIDRTANLSFAWEQLKQLNLTLLPSQRDFLENFEERVAQYKLNGYLLAAPPGTGKTLSGISLALIAEATKVIVLAPKRAINEVWTKTLDTRFKVPQHYWHSNNEVSQTGLKNGSNLPTGNGVAVHGRASGLIGNSSVVTHFDSKTPDVSAKWFIFHYEQLDTALAMVAGAYGNWDSKRTVILLDECHNLNETSSQRSAKFIELVKASEPLYTLWASGTPIKAIGNEAIPFLRTIDKLFTPEVQERFVMIFGKQASRAVDILSHRIGLSSFKVPKADVVTIQVSELTKNVSFKGAEAYTLEKIRDEIKKFVDERMTYYKVNYRMFQAQYDDLLIKYKKTIRDKEELKAFELYQSYVKHLNKYFDPRADKEIVIYCNRFEASKIVPKLSNQDKKVFRHVTSIVKYVSLKVRGEALGRILTRRRIDCFVAMIPHCGLPAIIDGSKKKTLIFTSYVEVVKALDQYLRKEGYSPLLVYGDTNKMLTPIMKEFKSNPDANPMIATFDSLSTAVPVIEANTCVLMNQPFRDHEREQATSRVNRLGQDTPVDIITTLVDTGMEPNISTRSNEILEWSRASVAAIMGLGDLDDNVYSSEDFVPSEEDQSNIKELDIFFGEQLAPKPAKVLYSEESFYFGKLL